MLRVLQLVPSLFDLALYHAEVEVRLNHLDLGIAEIGLKAVESRGVGPLGLERGYRLGVRPFELDVFRDAGKALALRC